MALTARQRAMVNGAAVAAGRCVAFIVGIMLVPFVLGKLGKSQYGIYQFVRSVMDYIPIVIFSVSPALSRYVTAAHARDDRDAVNRYMSTGFWIFVICAVFILAVGAAVASALPHVTNLGAYATDSQWLLVFFTLSFVVSYISGLFSAPLTALEKLAETTSLWTLSDVIRATVIFLLFSFVSVRLFWLGAAAVVGVAITSSIMVWSAFRVFPWLRISRKLFDRSVTRELVSFSFFSTLSALVSAIYFSTDNLLIKWLFVKNDTVMITIYSFGAQWSVWLRTGIPPLFRVILPRLTMMAAREQMADLRRVTVISIRYAFAATVPLCVFISIFAEPILAVWLGDRLLPSERHTSAGVVPILVIPLALFLGMAPAQSVFVARAKISTPTIVGLIGAVTNLVLSVVLCKYAGWGLYGIAAGTGITFMFRAVLFVPYYLSLLIELPVFELVKQALVPSMVVVALITLVMFGIQFVAPPTGLAGLATACALSVAVYTVLAWFIVVLPEDKQRIATHLGKLLKRRSTP